MDIVKTASYWAQFEMLSATVFAAFGLAFLLVGVGFRLLGTTDLARGFVIPMLVAGRQLPVLGAGLFLLAQTRLAAIPTAFGRDPAAFVASALARTDKVLSDYRTAVFRVFPALIALCALLIPFLEGPIWRAGLITAIAMVTILILLDSNADARLRLYKAQLASAPSSS